MMKKNHVFLITFLSLIQSQLVLSKDIEKLSEKFPDTLNHIIHDVESVIDPNWFIEKNDSGFTLFYCPTCQSEYIRFSSIDNILSDTSLYENGYPTRNDFLTQYGPDSLHFRNMIGGYDPGSKEQNPYPKNGILKLDVYFQPKWSQSKIDHSQKKNDEIKLCVNENHRRIHSVSFYDYRLFIHDKFWDCDSMIRLPYSSSWYNYSIFIVLDPDNYFSLPLWPEDGTDLHSYLFRTMRTLAFSLGINDFTTLEEIHQKVINEKKKR